MTNALGAAPSIVHLSHRENMALGRLVAELVEHFPQQLVEIRLFGSKARGTAEAESDIDVLLVLEEYNEDLRDQVLNVVSRINTESANMMLAPFILDREGLKAEQQKRTLLYRNLRDDGIRLWAKKGTDPWNEEGVEVVGRQEDVKWEISMAKEDLELAREMYERGNLRTAAAKAYFAAFHAVSAALLTENIERAKHRGVIAAFHEYLIRQGKISLTEPKVLDRLLELRQKADYGRPPGITSDQVEKALADASAVVGECVRFCESWLGRTPPL